MAKKALNVLKYLLSVALAALLVYFACRGIDWKEFLVGLRATRWFWVALFLIASVFAVLFRAMRWKQLLRPLDPSIKFGKVWDASNVGALCSVAIPGSGEFVRCGMIRTEKASYEKVFGTMLMERGWDAVCVILIFFASLVAKWGKFGGFFVDNIWHPITSQKTVLYILLGLILLIIIGLVIIFKFRDRFGVFDYLASMLGGLKVGFLSFLGIQNKLLFLLYTIGIWVMYTLMTYFCLLAVPELSTLNCGDAVFISALGNIASIVPVPGGIGAYHYLLKLTLTSLYGVTEEIGLLFAMLCHEAHAILIIVLGACSYVMRVLVMKNKSAAQIRDEVRKK